MPQSIYPADQLLAWLEQNKDKGIAVTVYMGEDRAIRRGSASTSDFSQASLKATVEAAYNIARFTAADDCAGLPDEDTLDEDNDIFGWIHLDHVIIGFDPAPGSASSLW